MTNLWSSFVRLVSKRGNGGSAPPQPERAAPVANGPVVARDHTDPAGVSATDPSPVPPVAPPADPVPNGAANEPDPAAAPAPAAEMQVTRPEPQEPAPAAPEPEAEGIAGPAVEAPPPAPASGPLQAAQAQTDSDAADAAAVAAHAPPPQAADPKGDHAAAPAAEPMPAVHVSRAAPESREKIVKAYPWAQSKFVGGVTELVLLTPITPGPIPGERRTHEERLRSELGSIQRRVDRGLNTPISVIPTIHYAGWQVLRPEQYLQGAVFPRNAPPTLDPYAPADQPATHDYRFRTWLHFTSYFDGDLKDYLREFSNFLGKDVDRVWGNCEGYPEGGSYDFEAFWQYAKRYQIETDAFFNAYPGISVPKIHQLKVFKDRFAAFVRATRGPDGSSVEGVGDLLDRFILENQAYTADFPAVGGTYDTEQSNRIADLRKS